MMNEKKIFLFSATFVTIIITANTQQQWSFPYYKPTCQNTQSFGTINPIKRLLAQPPVIPSQKIDVAINQSVKPIYWSTLLPTPVETYLKPEFVSNDNNNVDLANNLNLGSALDANYFTKLLLDYMNSITYGNTANKEAEKINDNEFRRNKQERKQIKRKSKGNNNHVIRQNDYMKRKRIQEHNLEKQNQDRIRKKKYQRKYEQTSRNRNDHFKSPTRNRNQGSASERNGKTASKRICKTCECSSNLQSQKKINQVKSQECNCSQLKKLKQIENNEGSDFRTVESNMKEPIKKYNSEEKITNFDQRSVDVDDILNINLEYSDCDCECVRNSRNNDNYKQSRKKYSDTPNNFPLDYLNIIYNLMPNQKFGSFLPNNDYFFPYNLDYLYQLPKKQTKKGNNKVPKEKKTKSSGKSSKKSTSKECSCKKRKSDISDKPQNGCVDENTVINLTPKVMNVELTEQVPYTDSIAAKYISNLDVAENSMLSDFSSIVSDLPSILSSNYVPDINEIVQNADIQKSPEAYEFKIQNIAEDLQENKKQDMQENNQQDIQKNIITEDIKQSPKPANEFMLQNVPTDGLQNKDMQENINYEDVKEYFEPINGFKQESVHEDIQQNNQQNLREKIQHIKPQNSQEITSVVEHDNPNSEREELIIPLLPDDDYFWNDYYPDFTLDNDAYLTSSEEDDWANFHRYFYSNDIENNKEKLKRNLIGRPKPKSKWSNSQTNPPNRKSNLKPNNEFPNPANLEYPDFITRIVNKEDIPSYIDIRTEKNKQVKSIPNNPTHSNYKINDIETVYAPSRVINYSLKSKFNTYDSSEESEENIFFRREGDIAIVYSSPFVLTE